jgi:glycosyltransferase involved in cell wall biosynthesis
MCAVPEHFPVELTPRLVSVVVPTFNREQYVGETVASVLGQSYHSVEVIVVDDGSTDGTRQLLQNRFGRDPRFRYVWQQNSERSVARNRGFRESKGEFVAFLDSDDLWPFHKLEWQMAVFDREPSVEMVVGRVGVVDPKGVHVRDCLDPHFERYDGTQLFRKMLFWNVIGSGVPLIKRAALDRTGGFNEDRRLLCFEDWEMWTRAVYWLKVGHVPAVVMLRRQHPDNTEQPVSPRIYRLLVRQVKTYMRRQDQADVMQFTGAHYWRLIERTARHVPKARVLMHLALGVPVFGVSGMWPRSPRQKWILGRLVEGARFA